jgi:hypothetical protein
VPVFLFENVNGNFEERKKSQLTLLAHDEACIYTELKSILPLLGDFCLGTCVVHCTRKVSEKTRFGLFTRPKMKRKMELDRMVRKGNQERRNLLK